ncbi:MAG: hypothetical protein PHT34_07170 [Oscillospiraceae bacterium]|nr:hypothetical protein [Oscillospiraceae bacterium]
MYGRIVLFPRGFFPRRTRYVRERICGVTFLRAEVFLPPEARSGAVHRALERTARELKKQGFSYAVTPPDFSFGEILRQCGLIPVSTAGLCRAMAASMAFLALEAEGIDPSKATVGLAAGRVTKAVEQAAIGLCARVRHLALEIPSGGGALCRFLRGEYGMAVMEGATGLQRADVLVLFSRVRQEYLPKNGIVLYLADDAPFSAYPGKIIRSAVFSPKEGLILPSGSDETQLLAALYECRAISPKEIEIQDLS